MFACKNGNDTAVYMSWNGATEVQRWTVLGGKAKETLDEVASVDKSGFETKATVSGQLGYIRAEASGQGIETGVSKIVAVEKC